MREGEEPAEKRWAVFRFDDNGNRFLMREHLPREEAEKVVREFEARGHMQVYWVEAEEGLGR